MQYYPIDETLARRAREMTSYSDYVPGSATAEYRRSVDEAASLAERQKQKVDPIHHERIDQLLDAYARRLAENINQGYVNRIGSVLSPVPLKREGTAVRRVNGQFLLLGSTLTLREYCRDNGLDFPAKNQNFHIRPASPEEAGLFYALSPEEDAEQGAIGHVRIDFGRSGDEFHHSWWPRGPEELNSPEFKQELGEVIDELRLSVLKGLGSMHSYCSGHGGQIEGGVCCQNYGYVVETERYLYRLRCNPIEGDSAMKP